MAGVRRPDGHAAVAESASLVYPQSRFRLLRLADLLMQQAFGSGSATRLRSRSPAKARHSPAVEGGDHAHGQIVLPSA